MQSEALEKLQTLGFSEYEARSYLTLLQRGPLTGYQVARASGIPRPNVYPVLDRLQERGAVSRIEVEGGGQYVALPAEEMLTRLGRETTARLESAREALWAVQKAPEKPQVWNLQGYEVVMGRARELIDGAREKVLIGIWSDESRRLADALAGAEARGVGITILCIQGCPDECGGCRGEVFRYPLASPEDKRWLVVSIDDRELLVAQIGAGEAVAAVTRLQVIVAVGSHYLRNAVAAAEITRSLGPRMQELLDERAVRALRSAGLATGASSWLERMLAVAGGSR
jgi:sugar-specific transcriptional regulator TrmB